MHIRFFTRRKYPAYFSIEQLFTAICQSISKSLGNNGTADMVEVPWFFSPLNFFRNIWFVRKHQAGVNHITGDIHYAILGCSNKQLNVLTIHDCVILERYRRWDPRYWIFRIFWYDLPMRKADLITVISEKTRIDLLNKVGYGANKIKIVSNFVNDAFEYSPRIFNADKPDILFIGSTDNKNLNRVIPALADIRCRLQVIGKLSEKQLQMIAEYKIDVQLSFELSLPELVDKYKSCDLVLFPSLYEGFGLLIIEAQAVGRPVITSNLSPMTDVAKKGAVFVDPFSVVSIKEGVLKVINDNALRQSLIEEGLANAKLYRQEVVANNYLLLYNQFLQKQAPGNN